MQAIDLQPDPSATAEHYWPIDSPSHHSPENLKSGVENNTEIENVKENNGTNVSASDNNGNSRVVSRRERPSRACTQRAAARLQAAAEAEERKRKKKRKERLAARLLREEYEEEDGYREEEEGGEEEENGHEDGSTSLGQFQSTRVITPLLGEPEDSQLPRWNIRSMWQLASILNFLNVFRPLLNVKLEFSADEFETALITPNNTLAEIHMPLLKAIPPVTRMALNHATWITVLCRKLKHWWHWVAEGDLPVVTSHGAEFEAYNMLDPGIRVVILKALCDIRVEQEDIRNYIDDSLKRGAQLSTFRKERLGGDSYGVSYWYEDDLIIGQRLYREIRKIEVKKGKGRTIPPIPNSSYQWEAVATNLDEFLNVSEKLFSSKNRTEVSVGKKLKNNMLPEIEKVHKRKEKLLKKQHRQTLMLDSMIGMDGLASGRSLRDRKHVTYTFDDYDRSINEALEITKKKQQSPEHFDGRDPPVKHEFSRNGRSDGPSQHSQPLSFSAVSPKSLDDDDDEFYEDHKTETLDRSNRRRQRPQRYSVKDYVDAVSDAEADFGSDDIVGEVIYDDEYLKMRKRRKMSSSSEGDEEYHWDDENPGEEEEEEEEYEILSTSEDSYAPRRTKALPGRTRREAKLRFVGELQSGLRRSKRASRNRINYKQYEMSESDTEQVKSEKPNVLDEHSYSSDDAEFSTGSHDTDEKNDKRNINDDPPIEEQRPEMVVEKSTIPPEQENHRDEEEQENHVDEGVEGVKERHFLDLNELAPGSGFDDGPNSVRDEDGDEF